MLEGYARCLALKAVAGDAESDFLSLPHQLDSVWHEHVLETRKYSDLMRELQDRFRAPFLHHSSANARDQDARRVRFNRMRSLYETFYPNANMARFDEWDAFLPRDMGEVHRNEAGEGERRGDEASGEGGGRVRVQIRSIMHGGSIYFSVRETMPMINLMRSYCQRVGREVADVRFTLDGEAVGGELTPQDLGFHSRGEEEMLLYTLLVQRGC